MNPWAEVVHVQDISTGLGWVPRRRYDGPELRGLALELSVIILSHGEFSNVVVEIKSVRVREVVCVVYYSILERIWTLRLLTKVLRGWRTKRRQEVDRESRLCFPYLQQATSSLKELLYLSEELGFSSNVVSSRCNRMRQGPSLCLQKEQNGTHPPISAYGARLPCAPERVLPLYGAALDELSFGIQIIRNLLVRLWPITTSSRFVRQGFFGGPKLIFGGP